MHLATHIRTQIKLLEAACVHPNGITHAPFHIEVPTQTFETVFVFITSASSKNELLTHSFEINSLQNCCKQKSKLGNGKPKLEFS